MAVGDKNKTMLNVFVFNPDDFLPDTKLHLPNISNTWPMLIPLAHCWLNDACYLGFHQPDNKIYIKHLQGSLVISKLWLDILCISHSGYTALECSGHILGKC